MQNEVEDKVITNDDVLGDAVPYDQQDALRVVCYRLLEMPPVSINFIWSIEHPYVHIQIMLSVHLVSFLAVIMLVLFSTGTYVL